MTEAKQAGLGADQDRIEFEAIEELCKRMQAVLSWIANGDQGRFEDYVRVAGQTADEVKAALAPREACRNGNEGGASATDGFHEGDEKGAVVSIRRQGTHDSSLATAHHP